MVLARDEGGLAVSRDAQLRQHAHGPVGILGHQHGAVGRRAPTPMRESACDPEFLTVR